MAPSFEEILNKPTSEIKAPKPFPVGTYHAIVDGYPEASKSSQKQTDFFRFKYKIMAFGDDVDKREATEQQVIGKHITQDFYVTENETTQYMLKEHLVDVLGIENDGEKKSLKELLAEAPNRQLWIRLRHEVSRDGKRAYARVESAARA